MALTLSNPAAVKAVGDYMRRSNAYNYPLDAGVIDRLVAAGVNLGYGLDEGIESAPDGSTGNTKNALQNAPVAALLKLIRKYSGGMGVNTDQTPLVKALRLLDQGVAYETPIDVTICQLVNQYAIAAGFSTPSNTGNIMLPLGNAPYTTLIYLLYWVGTPNAVNPYTF
jgi:hypothetical protein